VPLTDHVNKIAIHAIVNFGDKQLDSNVYNNSGCLRARLSAHVTFVLALNLSLSSWRYRSRTHVVELNLIATNKYFPNCSFIHARKCQCHSAHEVDIYKTMCDCKPMTLWLLHGTKPFIWNQPYLFSQHTMYALRVEDTVWYWHRVASCHVQKRIRSI